MRLILYFFLYGILFYAIWFFFPEEFKTLVNWAGNVFEFIRGAVAQIIEKTTNNPSTAPAAPAQPAASLLLGLLIRKA